MIVTALKKKTVLSVLLRVPTSVEFVNAILVTMEISVNVIIPNHLGMILPIALILVIRMSSATEKVIVFVGRADAEIR